MKLTVALLVTATALSTFACKKPEDQGTVAADSTKTNEARPEGLIPTDQGRSQADREISAHVRKDVIADHTLGLKAKNVTIVTRDGAVTLRGLVATPAERETVAMYAKKAPGVTVVDDQLEVASN